jgi:hypothetical protein
MIVAFIGDFPPKCKAQKTRVKMPTKFLRHLMTYSNSFNDIYEASNTGNQEQIFPENSSPRRSMHRGYKTG